MAGNGLMTTLCSGHSINPVSANPTRWSNTLKQFAGNLPMNCLSVFDHSVGLALKVLKDNTRFILAVFSVSERLIGTRNILFCYLLQIKLFFLKNHSNFKVFL